MLGLDETAGSAVSDPFFRSRWVEPPAGVEELDPAELAPGFPRPASPAASRRAATPTSASSSATSERVDSALLLTRNAAAAAPGPRLPRALRRGAIRAAVVKSGNANAATGEQGMRDALDDPGAQAAAALDLDPALVAVAETGKIGEALPMDNVLDGVARAAAAVRPDGGREFSEAIMTTDACPKRCTVRQAA